MNEAHEGFATNGEFIVSPEGWAEANEDGCPYNPSTPEARVWRLAQEHGKAAASWIFDGNTPESTFAKVVDMLDEGDPAIYDQFSAPDFSGEWADDYTTDALLTDVGWVPNDGTDLAEALVEQWQDEVDSAFWTEVERIAKEHLDR